MQSVEHSSSLQSHCHNMVKHWHFLFNLLYQFNRFQYIPFNIILFHFEKCDYTWKPVSYMFHPFEENVITNRLHRTPCRADVYSENIILHCFPLFDTPMTRLSYYSGWWRKSQGIRCSLSRILIFIHRMVKSIKSVLNLCMYIRYQESKMTPWLLTSQWLVNTPYIIKLR